MEEIVKLHKTIDKPALIIVGLIVMIQTKLESPPEEVGIWS